MIGRDTTCPDQLAINDQASRETGYIICRDYLMEQDWLEGFTCSLPYRHEGSHRAEGEAIGERNVSIDRDGHEYHWVYEWTYGNSDYSTLQAENNAAADLDPDWPANYG